MNNIKRKLNGLFCRLTGKNSIKTKYGVFRWDNSWPAETIGTINDINYESDLVSVINLYIDSKWRVLEIGGGTGRISTVIWNRVKRGLGKLGVVEGDPKVMPVLIDNLITNKVPTAAVTCSIITDDDTKILYRPKGPLTATGLPPSGTYEPITNMNRCRVGMIKYKMGTHGIDAIVINTNDHDCLEFLRDHLPGLNETKLVIVVLNNNPSLDESNLLMDKEGFDVEDINNANNRNVVVYTKRPLSKFKYKRV